MPKWSELLDQKEANRLLSEAISASPNGIAPPKDKVFRVFKELAFDDVKVVILGQDPYQTVGLANGLAFGVTARITLPPSLRNVMMELSVDLACEVKGSTLEGWSKQGVLLLNSALTTEIANSGYHMKLWSGFTDNVIKTLSDQRDKVVFILWGEFAKQKISLINRNKHLIIASAHPSPLSARHGFYGSKPFTKANQFLSINSIEPIDWTQVDLINEQLENWG